MEKGSSKDAIAQSVGWVDGFVFEYSVFSKVWKGGVGDLVYQGAGSDAKAWGLVYKFPTGDVAKLDKQKGIDKVEPKYKKIQVDVHTQQGQKYEAFTYIVRNEYHQGDSSSPSGVKRELPSIQYRKCVVNGARKAGMSAEYVKRLERIPDNKETFKRKSVGNSCDF